MRLIRLCCALWTIGIMLASDLARAESLQMGISVDLVPVAADFDGTHIVVFGSIENADLIQLALGNYQVVVTVTGAAQDTIVREKKRIFGIWVNRNAKRYARIPSFYSAISQVPVDKIAPRGVLRKHQIGVQNLEMSLQSTGDVTFILPAPEFSSALRRIRTESGIYSESPKNLDHLSPTLFRAAVWLPPNVPIGRHVVTGFLFKNGEVVHQTRSNFRVQKIGLERWMYDLAHQNGMLYGIMAVLIAIGTGWLANTLFRKK